ncbi:unnamed protein product, partial [Mesorhabditis belari]|uniref:Uncharacterized protein n=1 Tax=Mesorhabditis belari TaxID=2138241 RepID=A0AAF3JBR6_9BILA
MDRKDSANLSSSSEENHGEALLVEPEQSIDEMLFADPALEPTEFEKQQAEDPFLRPIADEQQQFYSDDDTGRAVTNLIIFLLMFTTPFIVIRKAIEIGANERNLYNT